MHGRADNIFAKLEEVNEAGAEVLLGDIEKAGPALLRPRIITWTETRLWHRDTFGPVLIVAVAGTVELANVRDY